MSKQVNKAYISGQTIKCCSVLKYRTLKSYINFENKIKYKFNMKSKLSSVILVKNDVNIPLRVGKNIIKRQHTINRRFTSRSHCTIYIREKKEKVLIFLRDHSLNGTYVNDSFIKNKMVLLSTGDTIGLGNSLEYFKLCSIQTIEIM